MRININMKSLSIYSGYKKNITENATAMERISSGSKINSAKDNPLKIDQSEKLKMQIRSLEMASKNVQDTTSMVQTADTAMGTISEVLIRMKELVVKGASSTNTEYDKQVIQTEIEELTNYIEDTANNTEFNGNKILSNANVTDNNKPFYMEMQTGSNVDDSMMIPFFNVSSKVLGIDTLDVTTEDGAAEALKNIDKALVNVNSCRSSYGAIQGRLETTAEIISSGTYVYEKSSR